MNRPWSGMLMIWIGRQSAGRERPARCCSIPDPSVRRNRTRACCASNPAPIIRGTDTTSHRFGTSSRGQFNIAGKTHGPGTMLWHPDPHYEDELHTETGGLMLIVQYPGPNTGGRPMYDDRFNLEKRREVAEERTDI